MSPRGLRVALAALAVAGPLVLGACADAERDGEGGGVNRGNEGGQEGEGGGEEGEGGGDGY